MVDESKFLREIESPSGERYTELIHPGAPFGLLTELGVHLCEQDETAEPLEGYAVVFFPRVDTLKPASVGFYGFAETFSKTPEAAIVKFMDGVALGQHWETFAEAGHKVRRVRVTDLGPPATEPAGG